MKSSKKMTALLAQKKETKETNPKDSFGSSKIPFHLWPETASAYGSLALLDGACKYGRSNWRVSGVRASIYYDALRRHINAWFEQEDLASDSGVHHVAHALACLAIIVDALEAGKLKDDRMYKGGYNEMIARLTPLVDQIKKNHAGKNPKHFSAQDKEN